MDDETQVVETPEPESTPEPEAAPAPEPAPEPEPDPKPEWLNEPQEPAHHQAYPQGPPAHDPGYYQRQQHPQYQQQQVDFSRFVENPEQVIDARIAQQMAPVQQIAQQAWMANQNILQGQSTTAKMGTRNAIENAYNNTFSKSEAFRGNKGVRTRVENHLQQRFHIASNAAANGDPAGFKELATMQDPAYYGAVLALARQLEGYNEGAPAAMGTAQVETPTPQVGTEAPELSADMEAALSRMGPGAKAKYLANLEKYGDDITFYDG
jgi:hypothetical protein